MDNLFSIIGNGIVLAPQMIILSISLYYFVKRKSTDGFLLSFGVLIELSVKTYYIFFIGFNYSPIIPSIMDIIRIIGNFLFALGILVLIKKTLKNKKEDDELEKIGRS